MVKAKGIAVIILAVSISDTLSITDRLLIMEDGKLVSSGQRLADLPAYVVNQPQ